MGMLSSNFITFLPYIAEMIWRTTINMPHVLLIGC